MRAEIDNQASDPRTVKMLRAQNALAADARTAGHEVAATLTGVAFRGHLCAREDAKRARHAPPRDTRTLKASFSWGCCRVAL